MLMNGTRKAKNVNQCNILTMSVKYYSALVRFNYFSKMCHLNNSNIILINMLPGKK